MAILFIARVHDGAVIRRHAPARDVHDEPAGNFAGGTAPDARVGSFGNRPHRRRTGHGAFRGDADRQREGSFGDHDLASRRDRPAA